MNTRCDEEPKRKRLKQSSIEESFKRHRSSLKSKTSLHLADKNQRLLSQIMHQSVSSPSEDELRKKRALLADAAEKRRESTSNTAVTSATSTASSDMVPEGGSKDGLSDNDNTLPDEFDDSSLLFPDTPPQAPPSEEILQHFVTGGAPLSSLNVVPMCSLQLPPLVPQPDHTVLVRASLNCNFAEPPKPSYKNYRDKWDRNHVRMPCSRENLYPGENSEKKVQNRWELIEATLLGPIRSSAELQAECSVHHCSENVLQKFNFDDSLPVTTDDFKVSDWDTFMLNWSRHNWEEDAILKYNARYSKKWNFEALHSYFNEMLDTSAREEFFEQTLPAMVTLALRLPILCTQAIPLLKQQQNHSLTISQEQAACLLANAFFCTFPRRNSHKHSEYSLFPDINFNRLFQGGKGGTNSVKTEKLRALLHYFRRITREMPTGTVTFQRQAVKSTGFPVWESCSATFGKLHVSSRGTIEDNGAGFLQVDFANKYIGGGVIGEGCVQEEIRFLICPELILSRLFIERLDANECIIITGAERYSDYVGYAHTFKWAGNHVDQTTRDSWGRRNTKIVAIDAHVFRCYTDQLEAGLLKRELNKAFCGFHSDQKYLPAIATGNWGCGAFGGDSRLKGLIQMMASAACSRDLVYFTFGDVGLADDLLDIHSFITERKLTVGDVWKMIQRYGKEIRAASSVTVKLYVFMRQLQDQYECDTDHEQSEEKDELCEATLSYILEPDSDCYKDNTP